MVCFILALEVQRRSLEQLGEDKWERSLEEREAKYKHQLNIEVTQLPIVISTTYCWELGDDVAVAMP